MAVADVYNMEGKKVSEIDLDDNVFNVAVKPHVLHEVVVMQLAGRRAGTSATKGRSDVRGGGQKPYRQKGTGRARAGSRRSPLWRGGGVIFGPSPRDFHYKVPKKVRKSALKMALSSKFQENRLVVLESFELEEIKTRKFLDVLAALDVQNALIIIEEKNERLEKAARNVPKVKVLRSSGLNVYDILKYTNLILLESSVKYIEGRLQT